VQKFDRALFLVRNPFDAIWSYYNIMSSGSHVGGILRSNFNWTHWQLQSVRYAEQYVDMVEVQYAGIKRILPSESLLLLRYENLVRNRTRFHALKNMATFADLGAVATRERVKCAFLLGDHPSIHRPSAGAIARVSQDPKKWEMRFALKSELVSKAEAFLPTIVCAIWDIIGPSSARMGYKKIYGGHKCDTLKSGEPKAVGSPPKTWEFERGIGDNLGIEGGI